MNITKEKEKKKAAPKGKKLPSKTYINLAQKESRKKDVVTSVLGLVLILIVAGCVAKFGVIDQLERLDRAEREYNATHDQYLIMQQAVADYPAVEEKYRTYSRKWMEDSAEEGLVTVDRTEVLTMVEKYLRTQGTVKSLSIQGTVMVVNMSDMNLRQISAMLAKVEQQPLVARALLNVASSEDQETTEILDFTVTIALQPVEEEE